MAVLEYVAGTLDFARRQLDRVVTPETRQKAYHTVQVFAQERPLLFSFLLAQTIFSLLPLALFTCFVLGTVSLALISALVFSLFWIGVAALVLGTALSVTFAVAVFAWTWAVGAYLAVHFAYSLVAGPQDRTVDEAMLREKWDHIVKKEKDVAHTNGEETNGTRVDGDQQSLE